MQVFRPIRDLSDRVFDKRVGNAFSNSQLLQTFKDEQVDELALMVIIVLRKLRLAL